MRTSHTPDPSTPLRASAGYAGPRLTGCAALRLVFFLRITFEGIECGIPEASDLLDSPNQLLDCLSTRRGKFVYLLTSMLPCRDQPGSFEHARVLAYRRTADGKPSCQFTGAMRPVRQPLQEFPTSWIGQRSQGLVQFL